MNVTEVPNLVSRHFDIARRVCREIDGDIHSLDACRGRRSPVATP
ncbi:MAG: hypothetical protein WBO58_17910 [Gammaproteobacteria bacterium]